MAFIEHKNSYDMATLFHVWEAQGHYVQTYQQMALKYIYTRCHNEGNVMFSEAPLAPRQNPPPCDRDSPLDIDHLQTETPSGQTPSFWDHPLDRVPLLTDTPSWQRIPSLETPGPDIWWRPQQWSVSILLEMHTCFRMWTSSFAQKVVTLSGPFWNALREWRKKRTDQLCGVRHEWISLTI